MITRTQVVTAARGWLGTPWKHQASVKAVGADCIGLVGGVALEVGLAEAKAWAADPKCKGYGRAPDPSMLLLACDMYLERIAIGAAKPADILLFKNDGGVHPQHFAIVSEPGYIIHAFAQSRKVAENRLDDAWKSRIVRAYRYRGIIDG